jgi:hypothetical protein
MDSEAVGISFLRFSAAILLAGLYLVYAMCNLVMLWRRWHGGNESLVPFICGISGAASLLLFPFWDLSRWWWVPVVTDPGTVPILVNCALCLFDRLFRRK